MKVKLKLTVYFYFTFLNSLLYLEIAIAIRQVLKCFIKLPNTIILARRAIKVLFLNFLFISLKLGTKYNLKRLKPSRDKEKIFFPKL